MNFAVTGGSGFIGSHIVENLLHDGHSVVVIDNLQTGKIENLQHVKNEIEFHKINILDYEGLRNVIENTDGIFHQAALNVVQESYYKQKEYHKINVQGTENIFKIAKEFSLKVVYASSSSVYGNAKKIPIKENFERKPINPYGLSKLEAEHLAEKYIESGVRIIGLRYFNAYGDGQTSNNAGVITKFIKNITQSLPPVINGDGSQVRDFVSVEDIANVNLYAMKSKSNHPFFNIGSGKATSILELANLMIHISGLELKPIYNKISEEEVKISQADIGLAKKFLNWVPKIKLEDWLSKTVPKIQKRLDKMA